MQEFEVNDEIEINCPDKWLRFHKYHGLRFTITGKSPAYANVFMFEPEGKEDIISDHFFKLVRKGSGADVLIQWIEGK